MDVISHARAPSPETAPTVATGAVSDRGTRSHRWLLLAWAFAFFNTVRVLGYLPTMWAVHVQADSSQHSLISWFSWMGANATMAAWIHQNNGHRFDTVVFFNVCNALMCLVTAGLIAAYRL